MSNSHPRAKSITFDFFGHNDEDDGKEETEKDKEIAGKSLSFISRDSGKVDHHHSSAPGDINQEDELGDDDQQNNLDRLSSEINELINYLSSENSISEKIETDYSLRVTEFLKKLQLKIDLYESEGNSLTFGRNHKKDVELIESINGVTALHGSLDGSSRSNHVMMPLLNETSVVLHRSMVFLEGELRVLIDEPMDNNMSISNTKNWDASLTHLKGRLQSFATSDHGHGGVGGGDSNNSNNNMVHEKMTEVQEEGFLFPCFTTECVSNISMISNAMILDGHEDEFCNILRIARTHAIEEKLKKLGFDKVSVDDIQKMNWELLEGEIVTWIKVFKHCILDLIPCEIRFYESIISKYPKIRQLLLGELACCVLCILVNFAEAVATTKRSSEKLFKLLDIYETLRDSIPLIEDEKVGLPKNHVDELRANMLFSQRIIGEAAVSIFCQLENSIEVNSNKNPIPNGAIHPLTRNTMNYIKHASEYKDALEEVFKQHVKVEEENHDHYLMLNQANKEKKGSHKLVGNASRGGQEEEKKTTYAYQLMKTMDSLDHNLESKSKLYKDKSLRYIFLMNNGRFMLQKVRGSMEISQVLGDDWIRKKSSDVRNYHKSYQRETWTKILQYLNHEGLQVNGKVYKPYLKERFKNFNQLFDDIHKNQSTWVVSDEQLQSELQVSISAIIIPAYRSFLARFGQIFTPGRQFEKYVKFQPEDVEAAIEDLFDGNANSMGKRK